MKITKKIALVASFVVVALAFGSLLAPGHSSAAAPSQSDAQQCANSLQFKDIAHITCTAGGQTIIFTDKDPTDGIKSYSASLESSSVLCQGKDDIVDLDANNSSGRLQLSDAGSTIKADVSIYYSPSGQAGCQEFNNNSPLTVKNTNNILILLKGGSDSAGSLDDVSSGSLSGHSFTRLQNGSYDSADGQALYAENLDLTSCSGNILAVDSSGQNAIVYPLSGSTSSTAFSGIPSLTGMPQNTTCGVDTGSLDFGLDNIKIQISPAITNISQNLTGQTCNSTATAPSGYSCSCIHDEGGGLTCTYVSTGVVTSPSGSTTSPTCESNSDIGLEWVVCPALKGIDGVVTTFYGYVLQQLCVNTGASSTAGGATCSTQSALTTGTANKGDPCTTGSDCGSDGTCQKTAGNCVNDTGNLLTKPVEQAWATFKNIATALIVVVLLVMVISQAIGGGPFDAYTVRKLLPKLIAAVIIMQFSFIFAKWLIDLSNDAGQGIGSLMLAPFPSDYNSIDHALGNIGSTGTLAAGTIFAGAAATVAFSGITVVGFLLMALTGLAAVFVGFLVLFFRKMLIILCVITIPVALAAMVLPGTDRFWKLWRETFTKLLLMFPMIAALIVAGEIFGSLSGNSSTGVTALFAVLLGFFGPLFLLPKTFQWGGQALSTMGGAIVNGTKGLRQRPMKYATEVGKENRQFKAGERARRISRDPNAASRWDRLLAGRYNPVRGANILGGGDARINKYAQTVAEGQKNAREAVSQELLAKGYQNWTHQQKLDANEAWLRGESYNGINAKDNEELRLFAFKTLADLGDQDRIRKARQDGKLKGSVWLKGRAENISSLNQQASDMGIQNDLSTVSADSTSNWKSHTFKEWIRQLQDGKIMDNSDVGGGDLDIEDPNGTGVRDASLRTAQLARGQAQATRILNNQLIFDRLSSDQQDFVRQIATGGGTQVVHSNTVTQIPSGEMMAAATPEGITARESVISGLADGSTASAVGVNLAPRIIEAARARNSGAVLTAEQQGNLQVFEQMHTRAHQPDATKAMTDAYRNIESRVKEALVAQEAQTEQQLTAAGSPSVATALATEQRRSNDVIRVLGIQ